MPRSIYTHTITLLFFLTHTHIHRERAPTITNQRSIITSSSSLMTSAEDVNQPGFGFNPTEEHIIYYLHHLINGNHSKVSEIAEIVNICKHEPSDLPRMAKNRSSKPEWYFSSPRNSDRCKRVTKAGFWKLTGRKCEIKIRGKNQFVSKRYLVFYTGRAGKSDRTNWIMHEYYQKPSDSSGTGYVIYRLFKKQTKKIVNSSVDEGEPSCDLDSVIEIPLADISSPEIDSQIFMDEILNFDDQHFTSHAEQQPKMQISQGPSFVNLQGANVTIDVDDYAESLPQFDINDQQDNNTESVSLYPSSQDVEYYQGSLHTAPYGSGPSDSLRNLRIGCTSYIEAVKAIVDHRVPEMHMVHGPSYENFQQTNLPLSQSGAIDLEDNILELEKSYPSIQDIHSSSGNIHTVPTDSGPSESSGSLHVENIGDIELIYKNNSGWLWDCLCEPASAYSS